MTQHTPGPWFVDVGRRITGGDLGYPIGNLNVWDFGSAKEQASNARLIAAAPDLLAALQELLAETENDFHNPRTGGFELARAAIAKAEGRHD